MRISEGPVRIRGAAKGLQGWASTELRLGWSGAVALGAALAVLAGAALVFAVMLQDVLGHDGMALRDSGFLFLGKAELLLSDEGRRDWPLRFYSRERLFSKEARLGWVEPDFATIEP